MRKVAFGSILLIVVTAAFGAGRLWERRSAGSVSEERAILHYACPMHPQYTNDRPADCPACGMRLEPVHADAANGAPPSARGAGAPPPGSIHVSPERQQAIGIQLVKAERRAITQTVRTVGRVSADETRIYRLTAGTNGWIEEALPTSVGSLVRKDQLLGAFYARDFLGAQQAYFYALDAKDRFMAQNASEAQMASTNTQIQQSADTLRALGMPATQIAELAKTRERTYTIALRAPAAGFILERNISPGQRFDSGDDLFVIADLTRVWILADLFEHEANRLRPGTKVNVLYSGESRTATVSDVLPIFDPEARTMKLRLEMPNPEFRFRPGMFVDVEFPVDLPATLTVPTDAVIDSGVRKTVFVDRGGGYFEARQVETGWRIGDRIEITRGLMEDERIVVGGTFLIDSESRMKALAAGARRTTAIDPVCGMEVDEKAAAGVGLVVEYRGKSYYFCSEDCKRAFEKEPARFALDLP